MRLPSIVQPLAVPAAIVSIGACLSCHAPRAAPRAALVPSDNGLILQDGEGERRVRRNAGKGPFIIKVDRQNGKSPELVMGYEDIAPGAEIQLHRHLVADEILFVHRGTGTASLNGRTAHVSAGATIYVPRNVTIGLVKTGPSPWELPLHSRSRASKNSCATIPSWKASQ